MTRRTLPTATLALTLASALTLAAALTPRAAHAADAPPPGAYKAVRPAQLDRDAISRELPRLPSVLRSNAEVTGAYMVYIERDGHVGRVDVIESIPGGDDAVRATLRRWTFKPQPVPVRSVVRLTFKGDELVMPNGGVRGTYQRVTAERAAELATSNPPPELPDEVAHKLAGKKGEGRYIVYVAPTGKVAYVQVEHSIAGADEAIIERLGAWTFKPGKVGLSFIQRVHYDVPAEFVPTPDPDEAKPADKK
jgi:hypothetical protein